MVRWGLDTIKMLKLTQVSSSKVAGSRITETVPSRDAKSGGWLWRPSMLPSLIVDT